MHSWEKILLKQILKYKWYHDFTSEIKNNLCTFLDIYNLPEPRIHAVKKYTL